MLDTFIALLFAHTMADFMFQTKWMAQSKRDPAALGLHALIVYATAVAVTGSFHLGLLVLAMIHIVIDVGKLVLGVAWKSSVGLGPFLIDQALHLASLVALALGCRSCGPRACGHPVRLSQAKMTAFLAPASGQTRWRCRWSICPR